jgi:Protein of unknown function (DUF3108)
VYSIRIKWKTFVGWLPFIGLALCCSAIGAASIESLPRQADALHPSLHPSAPIPLPSDLAIPHYDPGPPPFRSGETLVYKASWIGIPAAEARIVLLNNGVASRSWTGKLWLRSSAAVDLVYRMRDYLYEDFNRGDLRPREIHILQHEKQRRDEWSIHFNDREHLVTSARRNAQGRTWVREFSGGEPWGPFSGAMLALSLPLTVGETYTFDVFSGGNRYVLAFTVDKREPVTTSLGILRALRIVPSIVWLSEGKFLNQVSKMVVWVSDDERHLPLRIEAAAFIGSIRIDLEQVLNAPSPAIAAAAMQRTPAVQGEQSVSLLVPALADAVMALNYRDMVLLNTRG